MIVVVGLGRETRQLLWVLDRDRPDVEVVVLDEGTATAADLPALRTLEVTVTGGIDLDDPDAIPVAASELYRSPGVSPYRPALAAAVDRDVPVTTPTGWWAATRDCRDVIAITGTKGKSTTSALTAHLLRAAGREVALLGNIGRSALDVDAPVQDADDIVLELSSYQLADLQGRVGLAGITTLLQDHVPWHGTLARYHADKLRLLQLADRSIVTRQVAEHPALHWAAETAHANANATGRTDDAAGDPRFVGVELSEAVASLAPVGGIVGASLRDTIRSTLREAGLVGEHLVRDAELALALVDARLGRPMGVSDLVSSLAGFEPLPHRLTPVRDRGGVAWVDDSISTVPESAVAAVAAYRDHGPVTVLLGGDDRGQDLTPLEELLADPGVYALLLPPLGDRLADVLVPIAEGRVERVDDLAAAVRRADELTPPGGAVLLSPAAPSFGSYRDFVARGEHFVDLVHGLP